MNPSVEKGTNDDKTQQRTSKQKTEGTGNQRKGETFMNFKNTKGRRRVLSLMMTMTMILTMIASSVVEPFSLIQHADAAASLPTGLNEAIMQSAVNRLGKGYNNPNKATSGEVYDCTSLIRAVMEENLFGNVPTYSAAWINQIVNQNLALTYNANTLSADQYVYCNSVSEFKSAMDSNANVGKVIVLKTATQHDTLAENGVLREGLIEIFPPSAGNTGHGALIVGDIAPIDVPTGTSYTEAQKNYAMHKYASQAFNYLNGKYSLQRVMYQIDSSTTAAMQDSINNGAGSYGAYTMSNGTNGFYQIGGQSQPSFNIWTNTELFLQPRNWSVLQNFEIMHRNAYGDSTIWKIEALSEKYGVAYTNNISGKNQNDTAAYAVYISSPKGYYYSLDAQKFTVDGTTSYTGPVAGYGYQSGQSVPGLGGGRATVSVGKGVNSNGLTNVIVQGAVVNTPRGTTAHLFADRLESEPTMTVYVHEDSSTYTSARPGVWKLVLAGNSTSGKMAQITAATYYESFADAANNRNGVNVVNETSLNASQWIDPNRTATYAQGTQNSAPNLEMINVDRFSSAISVKKAAADGSNLSGTATFGVFETTADVTAANVATKIRNYALTNGLTSSSNFTGSTMKTQANSVAGSNNLYFLTSTNSATVSTSVLLDTNSAVRHYWVFELTAPNEYDLNTDIFRIDVTPNHTSGGYATATITRYTTSTTSGNASANAQTSVGNSATFTNSNGSTTLSLTSVRDSRTQYDMWVTVDLDKVQSGTTTRVANAGYIILPCNKLSFKYSGTAGESSYSSYIGQQTLGDAMVAISSGNSISVTYRGNTYTTMAGTLRAIAAYTAKHSSNANNAAEVFMAELKTVSGPNGTLANQPYMQSNEFGYYVTSANGTSSMQRIATSANGTVSRTTDQQYFMLVDNAVVGSDYVATRDFAVMEIYAPTGYFYPNDSAYQIVRLSSNRRMPATTNNGNGGTLLNPASYGLNKASFYPSNVTNSGNAPLTSPITYQSSIHALRGTEDRIPNYYIRLGMYKVATNSTANVAGATFVLTDNRNTAFQIANGTSSSNGLGTAQTGTSVVYFPTLSLGQLETPGNYTYYIAEKTAPNGWEKNKGVYEVVIKPGTNSNGSDSVVQSVKYYPTSSSTGITLNNTTSTSGNNGIYGRFGNTYVTATETKSHTVTKNGTAVTDGTIQSVQVTLYDSSNTRITKDAFGNNITNPVTLNASNSWTYTWANLDSSKTYTTQETQVVYMQNGTQRTITSGIDSVFSTTISSGTTSTGSRTTHTNNEKGLEGVFGVSKYYTASDGTTRYAKDVVFGVYTDAACTDQVTTITTGAQGFASYTVPAWNQSQGSTRVFYFKELDNSNAKDSENSKPLIFSSMNTDIIRATVTGATNVANCSVAFRNMTTNTDVAASTVSGTYTYTLPNTIAPLYGQFTFEKVNFRNEPQVVTFNVYTDSALTNQVGSKETVISGGKATVSWTVAELENNAEWPSDLSTTKTFYVQEDASSVPTGYNWNDTVYTVVVNGATAIANSTFTVNGNPVDDAYQVVNTSDRLIGGLGVYKYGAVEGQNLPISGVTFGIYFDEGCTQAFGSITTDRFGYATIEVSNYPGQRGWYRCDGEQITLYLKETSVENAEINGNPVTVEMSDIVIQAVVNGQNILNIPHVYDTRYSKVSGSGTVRTASANANQASGYAGYVAEVPNTVKLAKGAIGVHKTDNNHRSVNGLQFDVYEGTDTTLNSKIATITTNSLGYAYLDVTTISDGTVASGIYWQLGTTKTFLIRENEESCNALNITYDPTIVTATATAVERTATSYVTTYDTQDTTSTRISQQGYGSATLPVFDRVNTRLTSHTVNKTFSDTAADNAVEELWVSLLDSNGKLVTKDAYGNDITNPVNIKATQLTQTWTDLADEEGNPYHAEETKIVLRQYKASTGEAVTTETITLNGATEIAEYFTNTRNTTGTTTELTNALNKYYYTLSASKISLKRENGVDSISADAQDASGAKVSVGTGINMTTGALTGVIAENITIPAGQTSGITLFAGYASDNATETFYLVETTPAGENRIANGYWTVTMNGVQGVPAESASEITAASYFTAKNNAATEYQVGTSADISTLLDTHAYYSANTVSYLFVIANDHYRALYGAFGIVKTDETGAVVTTPVTFDLYGANAFSNGSLTGSALASLTTANGFITVDASAITDGTVPAGRWVNEESGKVKTFYLKESSAPDDYIISRDIIRVTVTGAEDPADATVAYAVYENGAWINLTGNGNMLQSAIPTAKITAEKVNVLGNTVGYRNDISVAEAVLVNTRKKAAEVTKTWNSDPYADGLVKSVEVTLYDQFDAKVTKDAYGDDITNPITITAGNEFYQWIDLPYSNGTTELIYTAKETAIILADDTRVTGADMEEYMDIQETESETTKAVTGMGQAKVSANEIINTALTWNNEFGILKTDGTDAGVEAVFGIYTDEALTEKVTELATTVTVNHATYNPGTWWAKDGAKTFYVKEISNDGKHVLYPFTIKVTLTGTTRDYSLATGSMTASEIVALAAKAGVETTISTAAAPYASLAYIANKPIEVEISKLDISNDKEVEGATLTVYEAVEDNENGTVEDTTTGKKYRKGDVYDNETWISTDQPHKITNIEEGTYILSEVTAPTDHGYVTASDIVFTIENDTLKHTVTMYDERTELHIAKRDFMSNPDESTEVNGAVLELTDSNDNLVIRWTTGDDTSFEIGTDYAANGLKAKADKDSEGKWIIVINYIPVGDYTLTETTTPAGYVTAESIDITITDSAIVTEKTMEDKPLLLISKQDITTNAPVIDAELTIYKFDENAPDKKGDAVVTWTTSNNEWTSIPSITSGKYVLEETTTANGYCTAEDVIFEVGNEQVKVIMYDKPLVTKISKTDITTGAPVIGAELQVITQQDITLAGVDYAEGDVIASWTTDGTEYEIQYIPVGTYTLHEVLPPDEWGYVTANDQDFEIVNDKELSNVNGATTVEFPVEMKDDYTKVKLAKVNEYGELIDGAKLEIRKATAKGYEDKPFTYELPDGTEVVCAYTSTTAGIDVLYLPFGDYYLVEVDSPDGFFMASPKAFTVTDSADLVTVTMVNSKLFALPSTGSLSDMWTKIIGLLLLAGGGIVIAAGRIRRKENV